MIKFSLRPNLRYPIQLIIWSFIRTIERELIGQFYSYKINLVYLPLMFFGEFIFWGIIYLYIECTSKKIKENENATSFMSIRLIDNSKKLLKRRDKSYKIILLILFNVFFDFVEFVLSIEVLPKFINSSSSMENRLAGILIILQALFYRYILSLPILRHQIFSLIIISISLVLTIITEFIFQDINIFLTYINFLFLFCVIFLIQLFNSLLDVVDKYLFEYDYFNPFKCLMLEGLFGLVYSLIYFSYKNPFPDIIKYYENKSENNGLLIFLLIFYSFLCGGQNMFRVTTNKIYSPMAATLSQYFLNPIYITINFILGNDFNSNGKRNYIYFIINFLLSFIISFCGCVYNEFLILFFYGLQYETHDQISSRAATMNIDEYDLNDLNSTGNENDDLDD